VVPPAASLTNDCGRGGAGCCIR
jgi:hypothetical protein